MAFNKDCFNRCVKSNLKWWTWIAIGVFAVVVFLVVLFSWGLALPAAIAWAVGAYGASVGGVLGMCYLRCR